MLPYITIFSQSIAMYGVMAAAGIVLAIFYMKKAEKRFPSVAADGELIFVYGMIGMFIGAKLLFLLTALPELKGDISLRIGVGDFLHKYLYAGFVFYGGLYGALLAIWGYTKLTKVKFDLILKAFLPMIPLIHGFGRLGCFCAGCCYGRVSERWGVVFSHSEIAPNGVPLLPVQLIEAMAVFALFFMLWRMSRRGADGRYMLGVYLFLYSAERFLLEFLRGDAYRGILWDVSISQAIAVLSIFGSILLIKKRTRRRA